MNLAQRQYRCVWVITILFLLTLMMPASAQTAPKADSLAPKKEPNGQGEGGNKTLVVTVFGESLYLEQMTPAEIEVQRKELSRDKFEKWLHDYRVARTYEKLWAAVSRRYVEQEKLDVSKEELDAIVESVEHNLLSLQGGPDGSPLPAKEQRGIAVAVTRASLMDWKVCKSLYERYGGRVGIGSLGAWIAQDGQNALLKEHLHAGDIKFHHTEMETAFWKYAQREHFADAYPKGEQLQQLLAKPPYLQVSQTTHVMSGKRERIGSSLGMDIYRDQLKDTPPTYHQVVKLFMVPAMEEFEQEHASEIEMTDDEIRAGVEWMEADVKRRGGLAWEQWQARSPAIKANVEERLAEIKRQLESPATSQTQRPLLNTALRVTSLEAELPHAGEVWMAFHRRKFERYLYDNYGGGRIIHQQFGPEALDAQKKLMMMLEESEKFQIIDPELRKIAYEYWERSNHPGGFHLDPRILEFPWTATHQQKMPGNGGSASIPEK